jgi:UDP-glucose 4-epimerase
VIYFYNVYGPGQIAKGKMATVIGIFEQAYKEKKPLTGSLAR